MPIFGPVKRQDLIRYLRQLGFEGPYAGGRHQYLIKAQIKLALPNRIRATSAETFYREYCDKAESAEKSGRSFEAV